MVSKVNSPAQTGKVTVGLASHWPCVTDNSGITTYGLTALGREMSTPPTFQWSMAHFTFTFRINLVQYSPRRQHILGCG